MVLTKVDHKQRSHLFGHACRGQECQQLNLVKPLVRGDRLEPGLQSVHSDGFTEHCASLHLREARFVADVLATRIFSTLETTSPVTPADDPLPCQSGSQSS